MNELIKVTINENNEPIVSGRELYENLTIDTPYKQWFDRMCEYGFSEGIDFCTILCESTGGRPSTDHAVKLDMAKEIAMIQRNEKGKLARQYFIEVEKEWNSPDKVMARALLLADKTINQLQLEVKAKEQVIEEQKPKVIFADSVSVSDTTILVGELAKMLKQNGIDTGEKRLFQWLRENGYLVKRKGTDYNAPTQYSMDLGLFETKETSITHSNGRVTIGKTSKVTGKGQIYFVNKFKKQSGHKQEKAALHGAAQEEYQYTLPGVRMPTMS